MTRRIVPIELLRTWATTALVPEIDCHVHGCVECGAHLGEHDTASKENGYHRRGCELEALLREGTDV